MWLPGPVMMKRLGKPSLHQAEIGFLGAFDPFSGFSVRPLAARESSIPGHRAGHRIKNRSPAPNASISWSLLRGGAPRFGRNLFDGKSDLISTQLSRFGRLKTSRLVFGVSNAKWAGLEADRG